MKKENQDHDIWFDNHRIGNILHVACNRTEFHMQLQADSRIWNHPIVNKSKIYVVLDTERMEIIKTAFALKHKYNNVAMLFYYQSVCLN